MSRALLIVRRILVLIVILLVAMTAIGYVVGLNSSAFVFAKDALRRSEAVKQRVGEVQSVRLKLWGFSYSSEYGGDHADLDLVVGGSTAKLDVEMNLVERDDHWVIINSSIPL
jgi:hypothetical protein